MPDPTPQEVVEAREYLATIPKNLAWQDESPKLCAAIRTVLALLDEAERVLEPFADYCDPNSPEEKKIGDFFERDYRAARILLLKLKGPDHG